MDQAVLVKRVRSSYNKFCKALLTLQEAVEDADTTNKYLRDATIQRFEYTLETAKVAVRNALEIGGVSFDKMSPVSIFTEAFSAGWLQDAEVARAMVYFRNSTSHTYDENNADKGYTDICLKFYPELRYLQMKVGGAIHAYTQDRS